MSDTYVDTLNNTKIANNMLDAISEVLKAYPDIDCHIKTQAEQIITDRERGFRSRIYINTRYEYKDITTEGQIMLYGEDCPALAITEVKCRYTAWHPENKLPTDSRNCNSLKATLEAVRRHGKKTKEKMDNEQQQQKEHEQDMEEKLSKVSAIVGDCARIEYSAITIDTKIGYLYAAPYEGKWRIGLNRNEMRTIVYSDSQLKAIVNAFDMV